MGCDIHIVLERKVKDQWVGLHNYNAPEPEALDVFVIEGKGKPPMRSWIRFKIMERNYRLFGELAGVRTDGTLGNEPRGLPSDASQLTTAMSDEWGADGHSHSYLSLPEFIAAYAAATDQTPMLVEHRLNPTDETKKWFLATATFVTGVDIYDDNYDEYRICFWFDN